MAWRAEREFCSELDALRARLAEADRAREREKLERVIRRLKHRRLHAAFASFVEHARLMRLLDRVRARWLRGEMAAAFRRWNEFREERQHQRALVARILGRLSKGKEAGAFLAWQHAAGQGAREEGLLRRCVLRGQRVELRVEEGGNPEDLGDHVVLLLVQGLADEVLRALRDLLQGHHVGIAFVDDG